MSLNYLSYATLPLPRMGRDYLLSQTDNSIFRYMSLSAGEALILKGTKARSYLFVFLGQVSTWRGEDEDNPENISSGEILRLSDDSSIFHITANLDSVVYHVDTEGLDKLVSWSVIARLMEGDQSIATRLNMLMNFSSLNTLPAESAFELSQRMIEADVSDGDEIVRQGDAADAFYVIICGSADVWQTHPESEEPRLVAKLTAGDSFGEDALIAEAVRNATVKMTSDGHLLICKRDDFQELVAHRSIAEISPREAKTLLDSEEYELIDVRFMDEYKESYIENASLVPLPEIRNYLGQFKKNKHYILYCSNGKRSALGTMILTRAGIDAVFMEGGLENWPYETRSLTNPPHGDSTKGK
jgi:CRP-like cAMP-binding protein